MISPGRSRILPLGFSLLFFVILAEGVVLPVAPRRPADGHLQLLHPVTDPDILRQDRLEKFKGPCPVRQNMEHLQVDPPPVIVDPIEQVSAPLSVDRIQCGQIVRRHFHVQTTLVEIVPEHPFFQNTAEMRKLPRRGCHGALQDLRVHLFLQLTGDSENSRVGAACRGGHYFGGVIQLIPFCLCHFSTPLLPYLPENSAGGLSASCPLRDHTCVTYLPRKRKGSSSTRKCMS